MIELKPIEKKLILIIKGHFQKEYPFCNNWSKTLAPFCIELFGWSADESNYHDYLRGIVHYLLKLHSKIEYNKSGDDLYHVHELLDVMSCKYVLYDDELPIERAISYLCGVIQNNPVIENEEKRYDLTI